jgi:hypothetical protein
MRRYIPHTHTEADVKDIPLKMLASFPAQDCVRTAIGVLKIREYVDFRLKQNQANTNKGIAL